MGEVKEKSFAVVASGSGRSTGGGTVKGKEIFSERILDLEEHFKPNVNLKTLTLNMENGFGQDTGDLKQLSLNIQLICGPKGDWRIQNASIGESQPTIATSEPHGKQQTLAPKVNMGIGSSGPSTSHGTSYNKPKPKTTLRPTKAWQPTPPLRPNKIWQPQKTQQVVTGSIEPTGLKPGKTENQTKALVISDSTAAQVSLSTGAATCLDAGTLCDEIDRTWGSSSDWVLQLRGGKQISIPLSLIRQLTVGDDPDASDEPKVLLLEGFNNMGSCDSRFEEDEDEENILVV
jgi:hypothetical protein